MWTSPLHTVLSYNSSDVKTLAHIYWLNLKPEVTSLLYTFMIKAIRHFYRDTEILCYLKHPTYDSDYSKRNYSSMYARLKNVDVMTDRICSNLSLVHLQYWQITKMHFEKKTLLCTAFFFWCYVPTVTVKWHIKATRWQRIKLYSTPACYRYIYTNKKDPSSKVTPRVKATSQGSMTIF